LRYITNAIAHLGDYKCYQPCHSCSNLKFIVLLLFVIVLY